MSHWSDPPSNVQPASVIPVDAIAAIDRELKGISDEKRRRQLNRIESIFPDVGPHRRELYPKHLEFFRAGRFYRSRLFSAGNRVGKTICGAYESTCHLTGIYPDFWEGRRFEKEISAWACGTSNETTKNVVQAELLGRLEKDDSLAMEHIGLGTGMIPGHLIAGVEFHAQIRGAIKTAWIKHVSGKRSVLSFKSYEQGSTAYEGTAMDWIWMDESPDLAIYTECLMRTMTGDGELIITATPLNGLTDLVMQFMPDGVIPETQISC